MMPAYHIVLWQLLALAYINNDRLYFILAFRNKQVLSLEGLNEKGTDLWECVQNP